MQLACVLWPREGRFGHHTNDNHRKRTKQYKIYGNERKPKSLQGSQCKAPFSCTGLVNEIWELASLVFSPRRWDCYYTYPIPAWVFGATTSLSAPGGKACQFLVLL